jgi:hypothetical protein
MIIITILYSPDGCFNIHIDIAKLPLLDWWLPSEMVRFFLGLYFYIYKK